MKTVFSNNELPHIWARQSQDNGKNSNNSMFFDGSKIYSYGRHFCIADIIDSGKTALVTDRTYSNTTARHISAVRYAVNHLNTVYCPHPESLNESLRVWQQRIETELSIIADSRRRQITKDKARIALTRISDDVSRYLAVTDYKLKPTLHKEFLKYLKAAQSEKGAEQLVKHLSKEQARKERQRQEDLKLQRVNYQKAVELWKTGELINLSWSPVSDEFGVSLRERNGMVETSKGAKVSVISARMLFREIQQGKDVRGFYLDGYTVLSMNGVLKVGCHEISREEIMRFATLMEWI